MKLYLQKEKGNTLVIILVIVLAVIGVLGFVLFNNLSNQPPKVQVVNSINSTYKGDGYSFDYPKVGWAATTTNEPAALRVEVVTSDFVQSSAGISAGAVVSVHKSTSGGTIDEQIKDLKDLMGGSVKDIQKLTINGIAAFSYNSSYEGVRYGTVFIVSDKLSYYVEYRFKDGGDPAQYMSEYNLATSTFKVTQ